MKCGIYMILNKINNKIYIGQSIDIYTRWKQHRANLRHRNHENKHLEKAWHKYGEENFEFSILCECEEEQLNTIEQYYILCFESINPKIGYNKDYGGSAGRAPQYIRDKISNSLKGNIPWNKGIKTGHTPWNKGKKYKNPKISESLKGKTAWNRVKIVCLNTEEVFDSIAEAGKKYNLPNANIHKNLQLKIKSCGKNDNGEPLVWRYYKDYLNMSKEEIEQVLDKVKKGNRGSNNTSSVKVICLDTLEIFDSMREAEIKYGIWKGGVCESCRSNKRVGNIKYIFMKYDEYLKKSA